MLYQWILSIKQSNLLSNFFFFFLKQLAKGDLMDGLTGQNNRFGLGATEKKSG